MLIRSLLCSALFALPVYAQDCPTAADLDGGIRVFSPDGEVETFTRQSEHIVTAAFRFEQGEGSDSLLAQGIYLVQILDIEGGKIQSDTRLTYAFPLAAGTMPDPVPGSVWSTRATLLDSNGVTDEAQTYNFGAQTQLTIGACGYDMVPISVVYPENDDYTETLYYLPELGFALLAGAQDKGEEPDVYVFERIEAVTQ